MWCECMGDMTEWLCKLQKQPNTQSYITQVKDGNQWMIVSTVWIYPGVNIIALEICSDEAALIGHADGLAHSSVRLSVCPFRTGFYLENKRRKKTNIDVNVYSAGVTGVPISRLGGQEVESWGHQTSKKQRRVSHVNVCLRLAERALGGYSAHCTLGAVQWARTTHCNWADGRGHVGTRRAYIVACCY